MAELPLRETWESVLMLSLQLAERIEVDCRRRGEQFDALLVVPRGGYYPANIIARELGFSATDLLHACVTSYESGSTERTVSFKLGQMPTLEQVRSKNILIIEEVCDTAQTLNFLTKDLQEKGVKLVRSAALHYKPGRNQTGYTPDWFMVETDRWIIYPWETSEARGETSQVHRKIS